MFRGTIQSLLKGTLESSLKVGFFGLFFVDVTILIRIGFVACYIMFVICLH